MSHRNLIILTKIIFFYSIFYILMKVVVVSSGAWLVPNLILMVPFIILGILAGLQIRNDGFSWIFVIIASAVIILTRIYETSISVWLQHQVVN